MYLFSFCCVAEEILRHAMETDKRNRNSNMELLRDRDRLLKERQTTVKHLRHHYLCCLRQLLEQNFDDMYALYCTSLLIKLINAKTDLKYGIYIFYL